MRTAVFTLITMLTLSSLAQAKEPRSIYKSCNVPIYNLKQDKTCGVASVRNYPHEACGVKQYTKCPVRLDSEYDNVGQPRIFAPDDWVEYVSYMHNQKFCEDRFNKIANGNLSEWLSKYYGVKAPEKMIVTSIEAKVEKDAPYCFRTSDGNAGINPCNSTIPVGFLCMLHAQKVTPKVVLKQDPSCGVFEYNSCDEVTYKSCRQESFGLDYYSYGSSEVCGIDLQNVSQVKDANYFKFVVGTLNRITRSHEKTYEWENVRDLLSEINLRGRTIPFQYIIKLKSILNATDVANAQANSQEKFKINFTNMVLDYYVRVVSAYNNQRGQEILLLQGLESKLKMNSISQSEAIRLLKEKLQNQNISDAMKSAILENLKASESANIASLLAILKDFRQVIKNGITGSKKEVENTVRNLVAKNQIFDSNLIAVYLDAGDFNQAQLKIMDARAYANSRPNISDPVSTQWLFSSLFSNAQLCAVNELESIGKVFDTISKTGTVPTTIVGADGKELSLPFSVLLTLEESNALSNQSLEGIKFQVLDILDRTYVGPLNQVIQAVGK